MKQNDWLPIVAGGVLLTILIVLISATLNHREMLCAPSEGAACVREWVSIFVTLGGFLFAGGALLISMRQMKDIGTQATLEVLVAIEKRISDLLNSKSNIKDIEQIVYKEFYNISVIKSGNLNLHRSYIGIIDNYLKEISRIAIHESDHYFNTIAFDRSIYRLDKILVI